MTSVRSMGRGVILLALLLSAGAAEAQVYKCTDSAGHTTYADAPCNNTSQPLKLEDDARKTPTDPRMCAQLQDELRRLAAESARGSERGHPESAASVKRHAKLTRQYEARCVGITRAKPAQ